jgi:hypothetical protein
MIWGYPHFRKPPDVARNLKQKGERLLAQVKWW